VRGGGCIVGSEAIIQVSSDHLYSEGQILTINLPNGETKQYKITNAQALTISQIFSKERLKVEELSVLCDVKAEKVKEKPYYKRWEDRWRQ
jgi:hypothetical protein